jgi:hypothetical protein
MQSPKGSVKAKIDDIESSLLPIKGTVLSGYSSGLLVETKSGEEYKEESKDGDPDIVEPVPHKSPFMPLDQEEALKNATYKMLKFDMEYPTCLRIFYYNQIHAYAERFLVACATLFETIRPEGNTAINTLQYICSIIEVRYKSTASTVNHSRKDSVQTPLQVRLHEVAFSNSNANCDRFYLVRFHYNIFVTKEAILRNSAVLLCMTGSAEKGDMRFNLVSYAVNVKYAQDFSELIKTYHDNRKVLYPSTSTKRVPTNPVQNQNNSNNPTVTQRKGRIGDRVQVDSQCRQLLRHAMTSRYDGSIDIVTQQSMKVTREPKADGANRKVWIWKWNGSYYMLDMSGQAGEMFGWHLGSTEATVLNTLNTDVTADKVHPTLFLLEPNDFDKLDDATADFTEPNELDELDATEPNELDELDATEPNELDKFDATAKFTNNYQVVLSALWGRFPHNSTLAGPMVTCEYELIDGKTTGSVANVIEIWPHELSMRTSKPPQIAGQQGGEKVLWFQQTSIDYEELPSIDEVITDISTHKICVDMSILNEPDLHIKLMKAASSNDVDGTLTPLVDVSLGIHPPALPNHVPVVLGPTVGTRHFGTIWCPVAQGGRHRDKVMLITELLKSGYQKLRTIVMTKVRYRYMKPASTTDTTKASQQLVHVALYNADDTVHITWGNMQGFTKLGHNSQELDEDYLVRVVQLDAPYTVTGTCSMNCGYKKPVAEFDMSDLDGALDVRLKAAKGKLFQKKFLSLQQESYNRDPLEIIRMRCEANNLLCGMNVLTSLVTGTVSRDGVVEVTVKIRKRGVNGGVGKKAEYLLSGNDVVRSVLSRVFEMFKRSQHVPWRQFFQFNVDEKQFDHCRLILAILYGEHQHNKTHGLCSVRMQCTVEKFSEFQTVLQDSFPVTSGGIPATKKNIARLNALLQTSIDDVVYDNVDENADIDAIRAMMLAHQHEEPEIVEEIHSDEEESDEEESDGDYEEDQPYGYEGVDEEVKVEVAANSFASDVVTAGGNEQDVVGQASVPNVDSGSVSDVVVVAGGDTQAVLGQAQVPNVESDAQTTLRRQQSIHMTAVAYQRLILLSAIIPTMGHDNIPDVLCDLGLQPLAKLVADLVERYKSTTNISAWEMLKTVVASLQYYIGAKLNKRMIVEGYVVKYDDVAAHINLRILKLKSSRWLFMQKAGPERGPQLLTDWQRIYELTRHATGMFPPVLMCMYNTATKLPKNILFKHWHKDGSLSQTDRAVRAATSIVTVQYCAPDSTDVIQLTLEGLGLLGLLQGVCFLDMDGTVHMERAGRISPDLANIMLSAVKHVHDNSVQNKGEKRNKTKWAPQYCMLSANEKVFTNDNFKHMHRICVFKTFEGGHHTLRQGFNTLAKALVVDYMDGSSVDDDQQVGVFLNAIRRSRGSSCGKLHLNTSQSNAYHVTPTQKGTVNGQAPTEFLYFMVAAALRRATIKTVPAQQLQCIMHAQALLAGGLTMMDYASHHYQTNVANALVHQPLYTPVLFQQLSVPQQNEDELQQEAGQEHKNQKTPYKMACTSIQESQHEHSVCHIAVVAVHGTGKTTFTHALLGALIANNSATNRFYFYLPADAVSHVSRFKPGMIYQALQDVYKHTSLKDLSLVLLTEHTNQSGTRVPLGRNSLRLNNRNIYILPLQPRTQVLAKYGIEAEHSAILQLIESRWCKVEDFETQAAKQGSATSEDIPGYKSMFDMEAIKSGQNLMIRNARPYANLLANHVGRLHLGGKNMTTQYLDMDSTARGNFWQYIYKDATYLAWHLTKSDSKKLVKKWKEFHANAPLNMEWKFDSGKQEWIYTVVGPGTTLVVPDLNQVPMQAQ